MGSFDEQASVAARMQLPTILWLMLTSMITILAWIVSVSNCIATQQLDAN